MPDILYFEEIRTLKTATQPLRIVNDSPVLAIVTVTHVSYTYISTLEFNITKFITE